MKVRAKDKDGKLVVGWYCQIGGRSFLVTETAWVQEKLNDVLVFGGFVEIPDIATASVETGQRISNG